MFVLFNHTYIIRSTFLFIIEIVLFLLFIEEFTGSHIHTDFNFSIVASLIDGFDKNVKSWKIEIDVWEKRI